MSVIFAGGDFTRFEPWQDIESTDNINAAAQERRGFPFQGKELAACCCKEQHTVTSSDWVGSKYLGFLFLSFFLFFKIFYDGMNKATPLHQQHQDLNFFLYLSEFSKEHLSRLAAILRTSYLLDLKYKKYCLLISPFQNNAYIQKRKNN